MLSSTKLPTSFFLPMVLALTGWYNRFSVCKYIAIADESLKEIGQ